MTRSCERCAFFDNLPWHKDRTHYVELADGRIAVAGTRAVSACRAKSPERNYRGDLGYDRERALWPVVYGEEWCGSFAPAGTAETRQ